MPIPPDLLKEIERELEDGCRRVVDGTSRLVQLVELHRQVLRASLRRGRPASVIDLFDDVSSVDEQHLAELVRSLRNNDPP